MLPGMRRSAVSPAAMALLAACVVPLSGCVRIIEGLPTSLEPRSARSRTARSGSSAPPTSRSTSWRANALADLQDFWTERFPDVYGDEFQPLQGGYFSVDPNDVDPSAYPNGVSCGSDPLDVEGNAFYCQAAGEPNSDSISYDRAFLTDLAEEFGDFIPDLVMAHEFGHAVQGRVGYPPASILAETQADCFAGAWTSWVADGNAQYTTVRAPELDDVLRGYLQLRDPVGTGLNEESAHGSYFDRVSAFQEGFADGAEACRDNFDTDRALTQQEFSTDEEVQTRRQRAARRPARHRRRDGHALLRGRRVLGGGRLRATRPSSPSTGLRRPARRTNSTTARARTSWPSTGRDSARTCTTSATSR